MCLESEMDTSATQYVVEESCTVESDEQNVSTPSTSALTTTLLVSTPAAAAISSIPTSLQWFSSQVGTRLLTYGLVLSFEKYGQSFH